VPLRPSSARHATVEYGTAAASWPAVNILREGCPGFSDDGDNAAMDFLLEALGQVTGGIFASVAHLLNLDLDIIFVDTTATSTRQRGLHEHRTAQGARARARRAGWTTIGDLEGTQARLPVAPAARDD
jgi:hypothetical protein